MENNFTLPEHLYFLETQLHQPEIRSSIEKLDLLLADDFIEFTSSGRKINKQDCLNGLSNSKMIASHFDYKKLTDETILITYELTNETRKTESLRSSIWRQKDGQWQMIFHQGTNKHSEL